MQVQRFLEEQYRLVAHRAQVRPHQNNGSGKDGTGGAGDRQGELGGAGLAEVLKHMRRMERRLEAMEVHQQAIEGHQQAAAGRLEAMVAMETQQGQIRACLGTARRPSEE